MASTAPIDFGSLITKSPRIHSGRPSIAGTGISVQNIAILHSQVATVEEIVRRKDLTLAQVHAALAYYFANRDEIEASISEDEAEYDRLEQEWKEMRAEGRA